MEDLLLSGLKFLGNTPEEAKIREDAIKSAMEFADITARDLAATMPVHGTLAVRTEQKLQRLIRPVASIGFMNGMIAADETILTLLVTDQEEVRKRWLRFISGWPLTVGAANRKRG